MKKETKWYNTKQSNTKEGHIGGIEKQNKI